MDKRELIAGLIKVKDLPTLPQVITRILEVADSEGSSAQDLTTILEEDHAISVRVLRLANSPYYGMAQEVDSIRRAVVVLGFDAVRNLALATTVVDLFSKKRQFALTPEDFWMHAFGCAKAVQIAIDNKWVQAPAAEACFTAALLHDIGKYLLALVLENEYLEIAVSAQGQSKDIEDLENEKLGIHNGEIGSWILEKWRFPLIFQEVTANWRSYLQYNGTYKKELYLARLADYVSRAARFGNAGDWTKPTLHPDVLRKLNLNEQIPAKLVREVAAFRPQAQEFLEIMQESGCG